jgi:hypothetical protein
MTNASARGATPASTVAAMVPVQHGRPLGMPAETEIAAHGDVIGEFLASATAPGWRWSTDGAVPMSIRVVGDIPREAINACRFKGERGMTEPDLAPRATVWPLLKARPVREFTDPLSEVLPIVGPLLGLVEDRMVRPIVVLGLPTSAARQPRATKGTARMAKSELVGDERSSESPG